MEFTLEEIQAGLEELNARAKQLGVERSYDVATGKDGKFYLVSKHGDSFPCHLSQPYGTRGIMLVIRAMIVQLKS